MGSLWSFHPPILSFFYLVIITSKRILNTNVIIRGLESTVMIRILPSTPTPPTSPNLPF